MSHLQAATQSRARVCYALIVEELCDFSRAFPSVAAGNGVKSMWNTAVDIENWYLFLTACTYDKKNNS